MKKVFVLSLMIAVSMATSPVALAAKLVPSGAPESPPPLQPLPENTTPDISKNVDVTRVQVDSSGTGQAGTSVGASPSPSSDQQSGLVLNPAQSDTNTATASPKSHTALIVVIILLVLAGIGGGAWLNNQSGEGKRKSK